MDENFFTISLNSHNLIIKVICTYQIEGLKLNVNKEPKLSIEIKFLFLEKTRCKTL